MLQTNLFVSLIEGRVNEEYCEKFLKAYQIDIKGPYYCCAIFHTSEHHVPDGMNPCAACHVSRAGDQGSFSTGMEES